MTRVLVTGGTGFLGAALVRELVRRNYAVRVFDNNFRGRADRLESVRESIEIVEGDVRDYRSVSRATEGIEWVFHLAFINGTRHFYERPDLVLEVGLKGAINTADAAREHRVKRFIVASSSEVYQEPTHIPTTELERMIVPDPANPRYTYGAGKMISELLALHYLPAAGVETVIFRPHNLYGPDMGSEHVVAQFALKLGALRAATESRSLEFPIQGTGSETRAFCFIDDAVLGVMIAAEQGSCGEIYNVGVDEEITIGDLARRMGSFFDFDLTVVPQPLKSGSTPRRCPDVSKLRQIGFAPRVSLEQGLRQTCEWYRKFACEGTHP